MGYCENLRKLCESKGWNQADLAARLGMSRSSLSRILRGVQEPKVGLAHEMAHGLTVKRLGRWRYFHLPAWKREGYADYVGKAHFDYGAYLAKLRAGHPRRDPAAGYYWRYELLVSYELEREGADPDRLFAEGFPAAGFEASPEGLR